MQLEARPVELEDSEESFFFRPLGGLQLGSKPEDPIGVPGATRLVASSTLYGLVAFSNLSGTHWGAPARHKKPY